MHHDNPSCRAPESGRTEARRAFLLGLCDKTGGFARLVSFFRARGGGLLAALILALPFLAAAVYPGELAFVRDGGQIRGRLTRQTEGRAIAEQAGFTLAGLDEAAVTERDGYRVVTVGRAFPVTLIYHGELLSAEANASMTVGDLLGYCRIEYSEGDEISPAAGSLLSPGDTVRVDAVTYVERTVNEDIPVTAERWETPLLAEGKEKHAESGQAGNADRTYRDRIVNGVPESSVLVSEELLTPMKPDITLVGKKGAVSSHIPSDSPLLPDGLTIENGVPSQYQALYERANCTAYTSRYENAYGAGGIGLFQGCVAVDPAVIPYGSLLYIASADGSYVYGWAIAADCGAAMLAGHTDIDCYFDTYTESCLFGRKYLNVYVVCQLTQTELAAFRSVTVSGGRLFDARIPK